MEFPRNLQRQLLMTLRIQHARKCAFISGPSFSRWIDGTYVSQVSRSGGPGITSFSCGRTGIPNSAILITASVRGHAVLDKIQKQTPDGKDGTTCRALSTPLGPGCVVRSTVNNPFRRFGKNEPHKALQKCPKPTLVDRSGRSSRLFVNCLKFVAQGPARLVEPLRAVELIHLMAYSVPRAVC